MARVNIEINHTSQVHFSYPAEKNFIEGLQLRKKNELEKLCILNEMVYLDKCIQLYISCETNKGQLVGMVNDRLFIREPEKELIVEYHKQTLGKSLFLYLRKISDIADHQSNELIEKGFSIGRPSGYSFSNEAILYLLSLHVDLFGMINSGLAKDINAI